MRNVLISVIDKIEEFPLCESDTKHLTAKITSHMEVIPFEEALKIPSEEDSPRYVGYILRDDLNSLIPSKEG